MMITTDEMKVLEKSSGIPMIKLMENAGREAVNIIKSRFTDIKNKRILIVTYHGNNGGDGFVAARYLSEEAETDVLFIGDEDRFKEEARINFEKMEKESVQLLTDPEVIDFDEYDIIIDAILGTGSKGELKEPMPYVIDQINSSKAFKVSLDIPSGLHPETGQEAEKVVRADMIIAFHDLKPGLQELKDKVVIADIGLNLVKE
ncbi:MAG TPA: NAD(P)H-hydrate epimerase [Candidatus Nanoarchaeia archaeon]|nr:NAD(P)H-hydrate epimerase [Candidatus Nanoarchaeia archaeon]